MDGGTTPTRGDLVDDGDLTQATLRALRRRWKLGLAVAVVVMVTATGSAFRVPTTYSAAVRLRLSTPGSLADDAIRPDAADYIDRLQNTFSSLASSTSLKDELVKKVGLSERPGVTVTPKPKSELLDLRVSTSKPGDAVPAANAMAKLLIGEIHRLDIDKVKSIRAELEPGVTQLRSELAELQSRRAVVATAPQTADVTRTLAALDSEIAAKASALTDRENELEHTTLVIVDRSHLLTIVEPAKTVTKRTRPFMTLGALGLALGALAGVSATLVAERFRRTVRWPADIEEALGDQPLLMLSRKGNAVASAPDAATRDAIWRLRTELMLRAEQQPVRSILVTSTTDADDAAWLAVHLGASVARAGVPVVVVDGDMTARTFGDLAGPGGPGLALALRHEKPAAYSVTQTSVPGLDLLAADIALDPDLITPGRWIDVLVELESRYPLVLINAPNLLDGGMAKAFAAMATGALLVERVGSSRIEDVERASEALDRAGTPLLAGLIVEHG